MRLVADLVSRLRSLLGRDREDRELDEEIRFHLESEAERIRRSGVSAKEARRIAHKRFGGVERMRERTREARGILWLERLLTDLRLAHRSLLRSPVQAVAAIVTLGLGIGTATTMFGTMYGAFWRALPWDDPERLVWIERTRERGEDDWAVPLHDFAEWGEESRSFEDLGALYVRPTALRTASGAVQLSSAHVTWNTFAILGIEPLVGRGLTEDDDRPGAPLVAVISRRVWEERFGADPDLLGARLALNGEPATIVGVMPEGFHFPESQDLWTPLRLDPELLVRGEGPGLTVFGHLAEGVTDDEAEAELDVLAARTAAAHPETNAGIGVEVLDLDEYLSADEAILINWMLMLAALAVLLIACMNVANLLLARAARRVREVALRSALGAGRARIIVHMLAESCSLALYGAVVGVGVGWLGVTGIRLGMANTDTPYWIRFDFDLAVLLFAIVAACGAGIVAGLIPAIRASRGDLADVLKDGARGSTGLGVGRLSRTLVGVEVAFSACLLIVSGLMVKSVVTLTSYDLPFADEGVLVATVDLFDDAESDPGARDTHVAELLDRLRELPGVSGAALGSRAPGRWTPEARWEISGRPYSTEQDRPLVRTATVTQGYFELVDVEPLSGRTFTRLDGDGGPAVAIVNRSFAETHFPEEEALGRRIRMRDPTRGADGEWRVVVGVVPDLVMQGLDVVGTVRGDGVYVPARTETLPSSLLLRSRGEPLELVDDVRRLARSIHPDLAVYAVQTLPQALRLQTWYFTITAWVFVAFGAVALVLACVGLLGVVASESERRTQEVGVRMALGARPADVVRLIVGQGTGRMAVGVAVGVLMATGLARAMNIVLFQTDPLDPLVYTGAVAFIVLTGALSSLYPALRASKTDPVRNLQAG